MKRLLLVLLALVASTASARLYVGFPVTIGRLDGSSFALGGVQLGNRLRRRRLERRFGREPDVRPRDL